MFVKDFYFFCVTATGQKRVRRHFLNEFNEFNMRVSHYENKWTSLDRKPTAEANNRLTKSVLECCRNTGACSGARILVEFSISCRHVA